MGKSQSARAQGLGCYMIETYISRWQRRTVPEAVAAALTTPRMS